MRLIFMGTPEFSLPVLKALISHHEVVCVYTQPPRPAGRGNQVTPSPVQQEAEKHGIMVRCPLSLKSEQEQQLFRDLHADIAVVCAYGLILPQAILDGCAQGCINVHASLLPRWRGAAPIQRAVMAGDEKSGVTIMKMEAGLDTGAMFMSDSIVINKDMTAGELHDKLAVMGADLILKVLDEMPQPVPQSEEGVTYAHKISKEECQIDWKKSADDIHNFIRGLNPYPKAYLNYKGEQIKVLSSHVVNGVQSAAEAGTLADDNLTVVCGDGTMLQLDCLQRAGRNALLRNEFLRGFQLNKGERV